MKLPKASNQESHPFIQKQTGSTSKSVRIALEDLSQATSNKYSHSTKSFSNASSIGRIRLLLNNTLIRWILLVFVLLMVFVYGSSYYSSIGSNKQFHEAEIPELAFTLDNLVAASIGLTNMAAEKIVEVKKKHTESVKVKGQTKEGVDEPVTEADKASNFVIINGLRTLFSKSKAIGNEDGKNDLKFDIISEEMDPKFQEIVPILEYIEPIPNGDELLDPSRISIIIDPLDATKEFAEETDIDGSNMLPFVTTLICIVQDEIPIAGIVGRPFKMFPNWDNDKNLNNDLPEDVMWGIAYNDVHELHGIKKQDPSSTTSAIVTISRSHPGKAQQVIKDTLGKEVLPAGGAGYKTWLVLTGQADAYIHVTAIKTWDLCAGHALLKSVGGDITDKDGNILKYTRGNPLFSNGLIASLDTDKIKEYAEKLHDVEL